MPSLFGLLLVETLLLLSGLNAVRNLTMPSRQLKVNYMASSPLECSYSVVLWFLRCSYSYCTLSEV